MLHLLHSGAPGREDAHGRGRRAARFGTASSPLPRIAPSSSPSTRSALRF